MSMTREEASVLLKIMFAFWANTHERTNVEMEMALNLALSDLRPVSREQVEKVWRGEWSYSHTTETDRFAVVKCSKCGHEAFGIAFYVTQGNFCPACGAAQTDEAVEMVMERMEKIK